MFPGGEDSDYLLEFSEFPKYLTTGVDAARISDQFVDVSIVCSDSGKICGIKCLDHGIKWQITYTYCLFQFHFFICVEVDFYSSTSQVDKVKNPRGGCGFLSRGVCVNFSNQRGVTPP